ncbi:MAG: DUF3617 domain-containing protein [Betaproteobacteria bacterium]|nr:DUF3617 domain-containing protein [Betaproteobacteria bacterium]
MICSRAALASLAALSFLSFSVVAADMPKRKSGLWEVNTVIQSGAETSTEKSKQCIDSANDKFADPVPDNTKCTRNNENFENGKLNADSVCRFDVSTVTTHVEFNGDFDNRYTGEIRIKYDPPIDGIKESYVLLNAKWLGPCEAEQGAAAPVK